MDRRKPDTGLRVVGRDLAPPGGLTKRQRWRLWDLHRGIHGALLALSFSEEDLRRLLRKAAVNVPAQARYYDIHRHFCEACVTRNALSETTERALEQRFAGKVASLRGVRDGAALEEKWREAWAKGRGLPAVFWAFLAHPLATDELRATFYADVHALFYAALGEREHLLETVEAGEHKLRALEKRKREEIRALEQRIEQLLRKDVVQAPAGESKSNAADLRRRAELAELRAQRAEARIRTLEARLADLRRVEQQHGRQTAGNDAACAGTALEPLPAEAARPQPVSVTAITRMPGVRIAYVGGRLGVVERIDQFCSMRGATFVHHDGGLEQSPARLDEVLNGADVIFYPVDCISHEAVLHLKAHAKATGTPTVPLRNASVSTFRAGIRAWCGLT